MVKKSLFVALALAVVVVGAMGSYRATSSRPGFPDRPVTAMMPAPDETIIYDDSLLFPIMIFDDIDRYWAVYFPAKPETACSVKAGLISIYVGPPTAPVCSFFVWDEAGGFPGEPPVRESTFIPTGFPAWDRVDVEPVYVTARDFYIGYWLPNAGFPDPEQDVPACDLSGPSGLSWVSMLRPFWDLVPVMFFGYMDLGIRAIVSCYPLPRHDVEPTQLFGLQDTINCADTLRLEAEVFNPGDSTESFDVTIEIDTTGLLVYTSTRPVSNLVPLGRDTVTFDPDWVVPGVDSMDYSVVVYTELAGDDSTENDTLLDSTFSFCVWIDDVGPLGLNAPGDSVWCDSTVDVQAAVRNYGNRSETFYFKILIDDSLGAPVYAESVSVTSLTPGDSNVVFPQWPVPVTDSMNYTVSMITLLAGDIDTINDTLMDAVFSRCFFIRDVGAVSVVMPGDTVLCDSVYTPEAEVTNYGELTEDFDVKFLIDTSGTYVYRDTSTVSLLAPAGTTNVTFTGWTVPVVAGINYNITVSTIFAPDMNSGNDAIADNTWGRCVQRDVGAVSVVVPGDTVLCDSLYVPEAEVTNYGELTEDFDVEFLIDTSGTYVYGDTSTVSLLAPAGTTNVTFAGWTVPVVAGINYNITVSTIFAQDMNSGNDAIADNTWGRCVLRDVGAISVVVPGDTVLCDSLYVPEAEVSNFGEFTESFSVEFLIDTSGVNVYADTVDTALAPPDTLNLTFAGWVVPQVDAISYDITVSTIFALDMNSANDAVADSTWGMCLWFRDVSPVAITWPVDTVYCDSSSAVTARVTNDGQISEDFSVEALIETSGVAIYAETTDVTGLVPNDTTDAVFPAWTVPQLDFFSYDVTITTLLAGDAVGANDTLIGTTYGLCPLHDGGVVTIDAPPETVDVDSTYTPCATVHNYGNRAETFDAICTINGYTDTSTVSNLLPDSSVQVCFQNWSAPGLGQYTMCVKAYVVNDGNAANDSLCQVIESVTGVEESRLFSRVPRRTQVFQNSPNPFSRTTSIEYAISKEAAVRLSVYDATGRVVKVLVAENKLAGYYTANWNGTDENGIAAPSGIYFYKLECGRIVESRKMVIVR